MLGLEGDSGRTVAVRNEAFSSNTLYMQVTLIPFTDIKILKMA